MLTASTPLPAACRPAPLPAFCPPACLNLLQVRQRDAQHVLFEGTAQLASPYKVDKQSTEVGSRLLRWAVASSLLL